MNISIAFSGPAGSGVITAGLFLGEILSKKGYNVVGDKEYESVIKGGNNTFILYISDEKKYLSNQIDCFFAYDKYAIERNQKIYKLSNIYEIKKIDCKYQNTFSLASAIKFLGLDLEIAKNIFKSKFKDEILEKNLIDLDNGYNFIEKNFLDLSKNIGEEKLFWFGNEALIEGAIGSGLGFYSAYPMTPASSLMDIVINYPEQVEFFQGEDEIAVSMSMLGAHFAGKRSMCGTSGGGFALMTESISFAYQAEIGGVYVFSQRAGPSTGTPTFTEQADLDFALNSGFGGAYPIVLAPDNFENGYNLIGKVLNRADVYQTPVVVLIDKMYSETYITLDKKDLILEPINKGKLELNPGDKFARYELTEDGISAYTIPGIANGNFIASSYEHDIYGSTSENHLEKKLMTQKRAKKINETFVKNEFNNNFFGYEIINTKASKFLITFGFNRYVCENALSKNDDLGLIIVKILNPIDPRLIKFFEQNIEKIDELVFVEMNYNGQFEKHIRSICALNGNEREEKITHKRKYELYPFFEEDVLM